MSKNKRLPARSAQTGIAYRQGRAIRKPLFVITSGTRWYPKRGMGILQGWREANPKVSRHSCRPKRQARPVQAHPASQIR